MMGLRIQRVVDGNTVSSSECAIGIHDTGSTAIGQDQIITGNEWTEWIGLIHKHTLERRGSIDVPERDTCSLGT